jgi:hypothetical protein
VPAAYGDKDNYTCYRGDGNGVIDVVSANIDNIYSDQYIVLGWKFGAKKFVSDDSQETEDYLKEESKLWKNYDTNSKDVLILASVGDDGTDVNESLIPPCK